MRLLLSALLVSASPAFAAFEELGAGARAPGMGNAVVALTDDVYAVHYNPAGLGRMERPELGAGYSKLLNGLTDNSEVSSLFLGYAHPLPDNRGTLAASWEQLALNSSLYYQQAFSLGYGRRLGLEAGPGQLFVGGTGRYLRQGIGSASEASNAVRPDLSASGQPDPVLTGQNHSGALDADLGALYKFHQFYSVGLAVRHLLQPNIAMNPSDSDAVPMDVTLGLNYGSLLSNLAFQYETVRAPTGDRDHDLTMAVERWLPRLFVGDFGLRGALTVGTRNQRQMTAGLSYRTGRMTIDYGFLMWLTNVTAGNTATHRVSVSLRFGSVKEPDESVVLILDTMRQLKRGELPDFRALGAGLTPGQKAQLGELLAQAKSLESQAKYRDASDKLQQALGVSPGDAGLLKGFTRLNWVAQQVRVLPNYKGDAVEAAWHNGILAYLNEDDPGALEWTADALALKPNDPSLESFLSQLERATGLPRPKMAAASATKQRIEQLLAQANAALEEGRYDDVISLSRQALGESSELENAWENLGTAFFAIGDYAGSLDAWQRTYALEKSAARRTVLEGYLQSLKNLLARRRAAGAPAGVTTEPEAPAAPAAAKPEPAKPQAKPEARKPPQPKPAARPPEERELSPREIQQLYNEGIDDYAAGRLQEARQAFERALKADPAYVPAYKALRRVMEELAQEKPKP